MAFLKGILATTVVASALLAAPALAQRLPPIISTAGDDPGFVDAGLGGFAPIDGRGYSISGSFTTLYDSNILRTGQGQQPRPGAQESDFRMTPVITARVGLPVGRQQLFAGASVGADIFAANGELNRIRFIGGGGINLRAGSRCTSTIGGNYSSRQLILTDVADTIPNAQETLSYGITANCQGPTGIGVGVTVRQSNTSNSAPGREGFNLNSLIISPNLSYSRPMLGTFTLSGSVNYVTYPNRFILTTEGQFLEDAVNIYSGRIGYQRNIGTRLNFGVGLSYFESSPQPDTILVEFGGLGIFFPTDRPSVSGLGYDASLTYTPSGRISATVNFGRNSTASPNVGALFQVVTLFGADINYTLGSSMRLGFGGTYTTRDYENSFVTVEQPLPRLQDKIGRVYGKLTYSPPRPWDVSLLLAYQTRASQPDIYSFNSFSAVLTLSFEFGRTS
jgi:hypothetical protein